MIKTPLVFAGTSDFAGKFRGKSFPLSDLANRSNNGLGWTPTNVQITCFDKIAEPRLALLAISFWCPIQIR